MTSHQDDEKRPAAPLLGRLPRIRVDDAHVAQDPDREGGFRVSISGHNLKMAISPPMIRVGGVELTDLKIDPGGKQITGTLTRKPESDQVTVDFGFASDETTLNRRDEKHP